MPTGREIDSETGQVYLVVRDDDGRVTNMWEDPGVMGAENQAFNRRMSNYGRKIADMVPQAPGKQLERARGWAQDEPYYQALREEYPWATGIGEVVAGSPGALLSGGRSAAGQLAANVGTAMADEFLNYDPLQEGGDYVRTARDAALFDIGGRMAGRVLKGFGGFIEDFRARGIGALTNRVPEAANKLTARGYKIARPSQLVERDHPLRAIYESMEMASESSALPSQVMRENAEFNAKRLSNTLAEAMGLEGNYDRFTPSMLADAETQWHKVRDRLIKRMPKKVYLPGEVADQVTQTDWARDLNRKGSKQYPDLMRYMDEMKKWDGTGQPPDLPSVKPREFFEIRADMTQEAKLADIGGLKRDMAQRIDALDAAVIPQTDAGWAADFARGREQWEVIEAAKNPSVMGKEGKVNLYALARTLSAESNFGRSALYGQRGTFTNPQTAELAGDVAALLQPETYANSRTTDRKSWLQFATSILDDPAYAASTAANTTAVNAILNQAEQGLGLGTPAVNILGGMGGDLPGWMKSAQGNNIVPQIFSYGATRPEDSAPWQAFGILPSAEVRDEVLGPFVGAEDDKKRSN